MSDENLNFLEHHGVKGMKWGVRKRRDGGDGGGPSKRAVKKQAKADVKSKRQEARGKVYGDAVRSVTKKGRLGLAVGTGIVTGGPGGVTVASIMAVRSTGVSKGKSIAAGLLGGPAAVVIAAELKVRRDSNT